jgi:ABC-type dipeptide/oligopeptide/nickel transport system permease component
MAFLRRLAFVPIVLLAVGAVTRAKGIQGHDVVRRHAAPMSYPGTFSFIAVSAPLIITNVVLVERTLSVPGFFKYTWRAAGHENLSVAARDPVPDLPLLCALGLWGAVLLIVLGLIADGIVALFDPRVRTSPERAW